MLAWTSFTLWVPLLPLTKTRPSSVTVSGVAPTVILIPTQPLKLLRTAPKTLLVTNAVDPGAESSS